MEKRSFVALFLPLVVVEVEHANEEHVRVDDEEVLLILLLRALAMMNLPIKAADISIRFVVVVVVVVPIIMRWGVIRVFLYGFRERNDDDKNDRLFGAPCMDPQHPLPLVSLFSLVSDTSPFYSSISEETKRSTRRTHTRALTHSHAQHLRTHITNK